MDEQLVAGAVDFIQAKDEDRASWYSLVVSWRNRENGGLTLQVCGCWRMGLEEIQESCLTCGRLLHFPPFRFSVVLCLLSAGTAAGVDLRLVEPAAAETPNRSRDGGGRAREAHICLGDFTFAWD